MHLAGEPDPLDFRACDPGLRENSLNGGNSGVPPVFGPLLSPEWLQLRHLLMCHCMSRHDTARAIYQQRPAAACSNINSEPHSSYCFMRVCC